MESERDGEKEGDKRRTERGESERREGGRGDMEGAVKQNKGKAEGGGDEEKEGRQRE